MYELSHLLNVHIYSKILKNTNDANKLHTKLKPFSFVAEGFGTAPAAGSLFGNKAATGALGTGLGTSFGTGNHRNRILALETLTGAWAKLFSYDFFHLTNLTWGIFCKHTLLNLVS